jgi:hypothetical protein
MPPKDASRHGVSETKRSMGLSHGPESLHSEQALGSAREQQGSHYGHPPRYLYPEDSEGHFQSNLMTQQGAPTYRPSTLTGEQNVQTGQSSSFGRFPGLETEAHGGSHHHTAWPSPMADLHLRHLSVPVSQSSSWDQSQPGIRHAEPVQGSTQRTHSFDRTAQIK